MAAPVLAVALGWIGATAAGAFAPAALDVSRAEAGAALVYEDLRSVCPLTQPLIDAAAARLAARPRLARLAHAADALCAAVRAPNNPANQAKAVAALVGSLRVASDGDANSVIVPRRQCGRTAC